MAIKTIMLRKSINDKNKVLAQLRSKRETLNASRSEFATREDELIKAINEASNDEEREVVEEAVKTYESDVEAVNSEIEELDSQINGIVDEVEALEREIDELENEQKIITPADPEPAKKITHSQEVNNMATFKTRTLNTMTFEQREALIAREDVKATLEATRELIKTRGVTNANVLIGTTVLDLIRENVADYSKLIRRVNLMRIKGEGRVVVQGIVPEAIWTECCAAINEIDISFGQIPLNCYKVAAYIAVCNASLEDSDIVLLDTLMVALNQSLGLAVDKAILYGTGTNMPTGVVTAIANMSSQQTTTTATAGAELISELIVGGSKANGAYSRGEKLWIMNDATYTKLLAGSLGTDANGAIIAGLNGRMPAVGGDIEVLGFIPDDNVIAGYFDLYALVERAGWDITYSREVRFIEDQTVVKARARYDGKPAVSTAFAVIGIGAAPTTTIPFAGQETDDSGDSSGENSGESSGESSEG